MTTEAAQERRDYPRVGQPLAGTWRGQSGASPCRISDIGWGGCFIQTLTSPGIYEKTVVTVTMPVAGRVAEIEAVVRYVEKTMGFAVKFVDLSAEQIDVLTDVLGQPPASLLK